MACVTYYLVKDTYNISAAQANFPQLVRLAESGRAVPIRKRDETVAYLVSRAQFEAIVETLELLSNSEAMRVLHAAKAGELSYEPVTVLDEDAG